MVNDWLSSTSVALMTPAEEGAFFRLLCHAWNEPRCCLPGDDTTLSVLSRLGADWKGSAARIRSCFQSDAQSKGMIFNPKQRGVRADQQKRIDAAKEHGRKAALG